MGWNNFYLFAGLATLFWFLGALFSLNKKYRPCWSILLSGCGIVIFGTFIALLWHSLERPPLRTMGETRLWYSFFLALSGLITYIRWRYRWILTFTTTMSVLFIAINLLKPEIHDKTLMPALQSIWFIPHVTVYMFAYSVLGCAFLIALIGLWKKQITYLSVADTLVVTGIAFLSIGMLLGSIWAKEAWGNYWSWDPKETWALITWLSYLAYLHLRLKPRHHPRYAYLLLVVSFMALQMCWYGVNYLPAAKQSIHTYSRE